MNQGQLRTCPWWGRGGWDGLRGPRCPFVVLLMTAYSEVTGF